MLQKEIKSKQIEIDELNIKLKLIADENLMANEYRRQVDEKNQTI